MAYKPFYTATTTDGSAYNTFYATSPVSERAVVFTLDTHDFGSPEGTISFSDKLCDYSQEDRATGSQGTTLPRIITSSIDITYSLKDPLARGGLIATSIPTMKLGNHDNHMSRFVDGSEVLNLSTVSNATMQLQPLNGSAITVWKGYVSGINVDSVAATIKVEDSVSRASTELNRYDHIYFKGFTIIDRGTGHSAGDAITLYSKGSGASFAGTISEVGADGEVINIDVTNRGTDYSKNDILIGTAGTTDFIAVVNSVNADGEVGSIFEGKYGDTHWGSVLNAKLTMLDPVELSYAAANRPFNHITELRDSGGTLRTTDVTVSGGSGDLAEIEAFVLDGKVTSISIDAAGTGYAVGDYVTSANINNAGYPLIATVTSVGGSGEITGVTIDYDGFGYTVGNSLSVVDVTGSGGTGATLTVGAIADGCICDVNIINPGVGYVVSDSLTIGGGGSSGALTVAAVDADGAIIHIDITNTGTGYVDSAYYWRRDRAPLTDYRELVSMEPVVYLNVNPTSGGTLTGDILMEPELGEDALAGNTAENILRHISGFSDDRLDIHQLAQYGSELNGTTNMDTYVITGDYLDSYYVEELAGLSAGTYDIKVQLLTDTYTGSTNNIIISALTTDTMQDIIDKLNADMAEHGVVCTYWTSSTASGLMFRPLLIADNIKLVVSAGDGAGVTSTFGDLFAGLDAGGTYTGLDADATLGTTIENTLSAGSRCGHSVTGGSRVLNFQELDKLAKDNFFFYWVDATTDKLTIGSSNFAVNAKPNMTSWRFADFGVLELKNNANKKVRTLKYPNKDLTVLYNKNSLVQEAGDLIGSVVDSLLPIVGVEYRDEYKEELSAFNQGYLDPNEGGYLAKPFFQHTPANINTNYAGLMEDYYDTILFEHTEDVLVPSRLHFFNPIGANSDTQNERYSKFVWDVTRSIYTYTRILRSNI